MLLGITGKKRAGKDSVAARLVEAHGFTRVAFADPLKASALDADPMVTVEHDEVGPLAEAGMRALPGTFVNLKHLVDVVGWEAAKEVREVRRFLQALGVSMRDHVDPDVWVKAGIRRVGHLLDQGQDVVITDVRFPNELEAINSLAGFHVHVERPGLKSTDTHVSETALEPCYGDADHTIWNLGTLEDLAEQVDGSWFLNRVTTTP